MKLLMLMMKKQMKKRQVIENLKRKKHIEYQAD
jgi:hypothetical protein